MNKSTGENRVRADFNTENSGIIDEIKTKSAELINLINELDLTDCPDAKSNGIIKATVEMEKEFDFLKDKACREIESGCMWGVKAVTIKL